MVVFNELGVYVKPFNCVKVVPLFGIAGFASCLESAQMNEIVLGYVLHN